VITLGNLADSCAELGRYDEASSHAREALERAERLGDRQNTLWGLALLAWVARAEGEPERAGRLWGAMEAEEARAPIWRWDEERPRYAARVLADDDPAFERGLEDGRRLALADAVREALGERAGARAAAPSTRGPAAP
jgi:hypothetical protein